MLEFDTSAYIYLDHIEHNLEEIRKRLGSSTEIMAVLKADAYGHGAVEVAKVLADNNIRYFAVANLIEALELRKNSVDASILVFGRVSRNNMKTAIDKHLTLTIFDEQYADELLEVVEKTSVNAKIHIKIETGLNRLGFLPNQETLNIIKRLKTSPKIFIEGIYSHFALLNEENDRIQFEKFGNFIRKLEENNINIPLKHMSDSIAAVDYPWSHMDMVRLGSVLYGLKSYRKSFENINLKNAMKLVSTVSQVKTIFKGEAVGYDRSFVAACDTKIATLAFGYADGYPRCLSNKGCVTIKGSRAPVVGKICMDQCMVDVSGIKDIKAGDQVIVYYDGSDGTVSVNDVAIWADTNKNEVLSRLHKRVPRIYVYKGEILNIKSCVLEELE